MARSTVSRSEKAKPQSRAQAAAGGGWLTRCIPPPICAALDGMGHHWAPQGTIGRHGATWQQAKAFPGLRFIEAGVRFWTPYVFLAGPISWFGLIMAQAWSISSLIGCWPRETVFHHTIRQVACAIFQNS